MEANVKSKQPYSSAYYKGNVTVLRKKARQRYHESKCPPVTCVCGRVVSMSNQPTTTSSRTKTIKAATFIERETLIKFD